MKGSCDHTVCLHIGFPRGFNRLSYTVCLHRGPPELPNSLKRGSPSRGCGLRNSVRRGGSGAVMYNGFKSQGPSAEILEPRAIQRSLSKSLGKSKCQLDMLNLLLEIMPVYMFIVSWFILHHFFSQILFRCVSRISGIVLP